MSSLIDARLLRAVLQLHGPIAPTSVDFYGWVARAHAERVIPLLHAAVVADETDLTEEQRSLTAAMNLDVAVLSVRLEKDLLGILKALDEIAVHYALLKGVAVCHLDYPDPSWRQFGDVDLLVAPRDVERALSTLAGLGWTTASPVPQHHRRFTQAFVLGGDSLLEVDLHQRLRHRAPGWLISPEVLLANRVPFELGDRTAWALSDIDRVLHACVHTSGSRGSFHRLSSVADVLLLSYVCEDQAAAVVARADQFNARGFVELAVREAWQRAQLELPFGWQEALSAPGRRMDRLVERAYFGPRRRPVSEELAMLRLLPSWRDRGEYLWGYFAVGDEYRATRGGRGIRSRVAYLAKRLGSR